MNSKPRNTKQKAQYYTASEAARELGVTPTTIYNWLDEGRLDEVQTLGRTRLVTAESVLDVKLQRVREGKS